MYKSLWILAAPKVPLAPNYIEVCLDSIVQNYVQQQCRSVNLVQCATGVISVIFQFKVTGPCQYHSLRVKCLLKSFIMEITVSRSLHMKNMQNAMLWTQVYEVRKPARKRKVSSSVAGRSLTAEMLLADIFYCS